MKEITYLIYIIFWESLTMIGTAYIVFGLGNSGWWWALGVFLGGLAYRPAMWIHGKDKLFE